MGGYNTSQYEDQFTAMTKTSFYLGTRPSGLANGPEQVTVTIEARTCKRAATTVDHREIVEPLELSFTYDAKVRGRSEGGGAGVDGLVFDDFTVCTLDREKFELLTRLADEWHLNTLHGECIHQERGAHIDHAGATTYPGGWLRGAAWGAVVAEQTERCPYGYSYGSRWLVKPVTAEAIVQVGWFAGGLIMPLARYADDGPPPIPVRCAECDRFIPADAPVVVDGGRLCPACVELRASNAAYDAD